MQKKTIFIALILILSFSGCVSKQDNYESHTSAPVSDFILLDKADFYFCNINVDAKKIEIDANTQSQTNKENFGDINDFTCEDESRYYLKTKANTRMETFLQTVSKENMAINSTKIENDFYSNFLYDGKLYAISSLKNEVAYLVLDVYNSDLSISYSNKFENNVMLMFPSGIVVEKNKILLICGVVENGADYASVKSYLYEFDLQFNLLNSTDLQLDNGGYQSTVKIGDKLYLAKTAQGLDSSQRAAPSRYIDVYNLSSKEMQNNIIELEKEYPLKMRYDEKNNIIVIQHERHNLGTNCYSIYNISDATIETLVFDNEKYGDYDIYYANDGKKCYFQTPNMLGIYNIASKDYSEYSLQALDKKFLNGLFFIN